MKAPPTCELGMESYYELVLTMLTIIVFSIGVQTMTTVWHNFQAKKKKSSARLFFYGGPEGSHMQIKNIAAN